MQTSQPSAGDSAWKVIGELNARLTAKYGTGLDAEQLMLLKEPVTNTAEILAMFDDMEAREGVTTSDLVKPLRLAVLSHVPKTKEEAVAILKAMKALALVFHIEDDPADIITGSTRVPTFMQDEIPLVERLVEDLYALYSDNKTEGPWEAIEAAGWVEPFTDEPEEVSTPEHLKLDGWDWASTGGGCSALCHRVSAQHYLMMHDGEGIAPKSLQDPCTVALYSSQHSEELMQKQWPTVLAFLEGETQP